MFYIVGINGSIHMHRQFLHNMLIYSTARNFGLLDEGGFLALVTF